MEYTTEKNVSEDIGQNENSLLDKYLAFVSMLTLEEFIELRKLINNDYKDLSEMISSHFGIRS